jgi:CubicO group peptidase (beta-lactamase class C family)
MRHARILRPRRRTPKILAAVFAATLAVTVFAPFVLEHAALAQSTSPASAKPLTDAEVMQRLGDFDAWIAQQLKDWNGVGLAVGIVSGDKLVFAKGYGFRDYGAKLPMTPDSLAQIASNSKLFTAVAAGMLVDQGKLTWDKPIRQSVQQIQFNTNELNDNVTLRDMLSHRTGVTRHDLIWFKSDFTRPELFEKLKYLEPEQPLRQEFLYNNLMFTAVGYVIELKSGQPWEQFVRTNIFQPLDMNSTVFTLADAVKHPEYVVPYTERRDTFEIYKLPFHEDAVGIAPAGGIVSNINDLSHWLIALMNNGMYSGKQVLPADVLKETLHPAIALPNSGGEAKGYWENLNPAYGMGRMTSSYRGHLYTFHGGDLPGLHSQVSFMPNDHIGVIVLNVGDHTAPLRDIVNFNVYERLLGMDQTPWSQRQLPDRLTMKKVEQEARAKSGEAQVPNTHPSHPLADYAAEYENPAYGIIKISQKGDALQFDFHQFSFPLTHFHYDRFDTPDDEEFGKFSLNFRTNPAGDIDTIAISLDEGEQIFTRKPPTIDDATGQKLAGTYLTPTKSKFEITYTPGAGLALKFPGGPPQPLFAVKGLTFRTARYADDTFTFVLENGVVTGVKERDPSGEMTFPRAPQ